MAKFFTIRKDGGAESTSTGYWLVEIKSLFSIALLKFEGKGREAYHTHAFNAISWLLKGELREDCKMPGGKHRIKYYFPSLKPIITPREPMHKVDSDGTSWALTFRGPWNKKWKEYHPNTDTNWELTNGRVMTEI